jgi:hypothetical protein
LLGKAKLRVASAHSGMLLAGKSASGPAVRLAAPVAAALHEERSGARQGEWWRKVRCRKL